MKGFISAGLHPVYKILIFLMFLIGGICVGMFVAMVGMSALYGFSLTEIASVTQNPRAYPNGRSAMIFYQAAVHFCMFTVAPLAFLAVTEPSVKRYLFAKKNYLGLFLLSALVVLIIMPANSWLINWNAKMVLPEALKGIEAWAKQKEELLAELTKYLTQFDTVGQMLLGLITFALIPAIGEELVFRGVLQRNLGAWFKSHHAAIWVTAFIFGAIHVQFYGFFPRMLLGALFGYLYFWSKNLWVPVAGHFMNNGFTVFLLYLQQQKVINVDVESPEAMPWYLGAISLVLSLAVLFYLRQQFKAIPECVPEENPKLT